MKKRAIVFSCLLLTVFLLTGLPAEAQPIRKAARLGFLDSSTASESAVRLDAFWRELHKLGWIQGQN